MITFWRIKYVRKLRVRDEDNKELHRKNKQTPEKKKRRFCRVLQCSSTKNKVHGLCYSRSSVVG